MIFQQCSTCLAGNSWSVAGQNWFKWESKLVYKLTIKAGKSVKTSFDWFKPEFSAGPSFFGKVAARTITVTLTGLVGGDVDSSVLRGGGALAGDAIDSLDLEAVAGVGLQVAHGHPPLRQAQASRGDVHVVVAAGADATLGDTLLTDDIVEQIVPPARVPWLSPLQDQGGLVYVGDDIPGGRGNGCRENNTMYRRVSSNLVH